MGKMIVFISGAETKPVQTSSKPSVQLLGDFKLKNVEDAQNVIPEPVLPVAMPSIPVYPHKLSTV